MSNLTVITAGTAITMPADVRKALIANLTALELAFADGRKLDQAQSDMRVALWQEALDGIEPAIAIFVTRRMRLFNPRNPFAPTPQDLFEAAQATVRELRDAVRVWVAEGRWSPGYSELLFKGSLPAGWFPKTLAAPFEPGCIVSDDDATRWASQAVLAKVPNREKLLSPTATRYDWEDLVRLELPPMAKIVARLPFCALDPQTRATIAALSAEHARRREQYLADEAERAERRRAHALRELAEYDANIARREDAGKSVPSPAQQQLQKAALRRDAGLEAADLERDGGAA